MCNVQQKCNSLRLGVVERVFDVETWPVKFFWKCYGELYRCIALQQFWGYLLSLLLFANFGIMISSMIRNVLTETRRRKLNNFNWLELIDLSYSRFPPPLSPSLSFPWILLLSLMLSLPFSLSIHFLLFHFLGEICFSLSVIGEFSGFMVMLSTSSLYNSTPVGAEMFSVLLQASLLPPP